MNKELTNNQYLANGIAGVLFSSGDLCDCKFSEDMDRFIEGLLTEIN